MKKEKNRKKDKIREKLISIIQKAQEPLETMEIVDSLEDKKLLVKKL